MTLSISRFSELIGEFYDAAISRERWPAALDSCAKSFGACFAAFGWENTKIMTVGGSYGSRKLEGAEAESYRDTYKRTLVYSNPMRVPVLLTLSVGDVFTTDTLVPPEEYHASRYYKEYVRPNGWGEGIASVLSKEDGTVHFFAMAKRLGEPPFDENAMESLKLLTPHVQRAYAISNLIAEEKRKSEALSKTFDSLRAAVFLLDRSLRVVYLNDSARALLAQGAPLAVDAEALTALDPHAQEILRSAVAEASSGDSSPARNIILSSESGAHFSMQCLPLSRGSRQNSAVAPDAVAALFITRAALEVQSPIEMIHSQFRLTTSETTTLVAVVEMGSVKEAAAQIGVAPSTVKTHLKSVFAKTGVTSQTELVKLVASLSTPVLAEPPSKYTH